MPCQWCLEIREGVRRSNFLRSKFIFSWGRIHEIEFFVIFHEVKIPNNDLISWSQHFSWDQNCLIMLFRVSISWSFLWLTNWSWDRNKKKALLGNFNLMIDLLAASAIMRLKEIPFNYSEFFLLFFIVIYFFSSQLSVSYKQLTIIYLFTHVMVKMHRWLIIRAKNLPQVQLTKFK